MLPKYKSNKLQLTELVLRDGQQSLIATRLLLDDMIPIMSKLDEIGFWSMEVWGGATFDSCIRYLNEDPWERLANIKKAMPNTPLQMLLRGKNLLGYKHYTNEVIEKFCYNAVKHGIDVFRIFDALNDIDNLEPVIKAVKANGAHAQGTMSYTISPFHSLEKWVEFGEKIAELGVDSIAIKDMSGLLSPYSAYELIKALKKHTNLPIHLHCHATTGIAMGTYIKGIEAGADVVDTSISSMSMTYAHPATEALVASYQDNKEVACDYDLDKLIDISQYFRKVRTKYSAFEGSLKGVDARIFKAQVPGGMLSNYENQLKKQNALDKMDDLMKEIPRVREDLGYVPLVTPSSQIVGTQAVVNVLMGRYKVINRETRDLILGKYGRVPTKINKDLEDRVIKENENNKVEIQEVLISLENFEKELTNQAQKQNFKIDENNKLNDILTFALFSQTACNFFKTRKEGKFNLEKILPSNIESKKSKVNKSNDVGIYKVKVNNQDFVAYVSDVDANIDIKTSVELNKSGNTVKGKNINSPIAGIISKVLIKIGDKVEIGQTVLILEVMKMETEVKSKHAGIVSSIVVTAQNEVKKNDVLIVLT